jgi:hypothetical protein
MGLWIQWPRDWSPLARTVSAGSHVAALLSTAAGADPERTFVGTTVARRDRWADENQHDQN